MPFVCHSLGLSFGFLKMCPDVLMGLRAVLMLALPQILPIRSDTRWTYGIVVKVFRWLPLSSLSTADFLGGSQVLLMNSDGYPFVSKSRRTLCFSFSLSLLLDGRSDARFISATTTTTRLISGQKAPIISTLLLQVLLT